MTKPAWIKTDWLRLFLGAACGGVLGAFGFLLLFQWVTSPLTLREMGFGGGVFLTFIVLPIGAVFGAFYGAVIGKVCGLLRQGDEKRAASICLMTAGALLFVLVILQSQYGILNPATFAHTSPDTSQPFTSQQNLRDCLALNLPFCGILPLTIVGLALCFKAKRNILRKVS